MCGIAAIFAYAPDAPPVDRDELHRVRERMASRGPDGAGSWIAPDRRVGLAHRRLAIIDLAESGAQPMSTADGALRIVFNGEIYNYRALRSELESAGHRFVSQSDTEIILEMYRRYGRAMLPRLQGMFAFALWDTAARGVLIARDPFGIKPLYYADDGRTLRVASQVKALLAGGGIDRRPDPAGHVGFFLWGHVPEPYTVYRGIRSLPAGTSTWIDAAGRRHTSEYFDLVATLSVPPLADASADARRARLRDAIDASVARHLVADVPVGVFLSAGLDSTSIAALATRHVSEPLRTVTLGFHEYQGTADDEVPLAEATARSLGAAHHTHWIRKSDFEAEYPRLIDAMDQPTIDGVNSYFISRAAASGGLKVALSGLGGDELLGGYASFTEIPRLVGALSPLRHLPGLGRGFRRVSAAALRRWITPKYAGLFEYGETFAGAYLLRRGMYMPWELPDLLDPELVRDGWAELQPLARLQATEGPLASDRLKVTALEGGWYMRNQLLRDMDWASMAHSLEVRVPLVDGTLWRDLAPMLTSEHPPSKADMALAAAGSRVEGILGRPKTGFSVPVSSWLLPAKSARSRWTPRVWAQALWTASGHDLAAPTRRFRPTKTTPSGTRAERPTLLVYRIGQLGDTLVALPALDALRRRYSDHRAVLLTNRQPAGSGWVSAWDVLGPLGWFDDVIFYEPASTYGEQVGAFTRAARRVRALAPARVVSLVTRESTAARRRDELFFRLAAPSAVYQDAGPPAGRYSSDAGARVEPEWMRLFRLATDAHEPGAFRLPIPTTARTAADGVVHGVGRPGELWIAIGPGSKMPAKLWRRERFLQLGLDLLKRYPAARLLVFGGQADAAAGDELCRAWGSRSVNLAGRIDVLEAAAVLERCAVYVGNDTGTMHLAGVAGVPCVGIFSARDNPGRWEPYGKGHVILRHETPCAGCMLEVCPRGNECLDAIAVEDVLAAATRLPALAMRMEVAG